MFDSLCDRFEAIFTRMRGRGRLGKQEVDEFAREIRLALLEADRSFKVAKRFIGRGGGAADRRGARPGVGGPPLDSAPG